MAYSLEAERLLAKADSLFYFNHYRWLIDGKITEFKGISLKKQFFGVYFIAEMIV